MTRSHGPTRIDSGGPPAPGRREFLSTLLLRVTGALSAFAALAPLPGFLLAGKRGAGTGGKTDAGPLQTLPPGSARVVSHRGKPALVVHLPAGPAAFGAVCTHLGCVVRWDANRSEIRCPCHGARYDVSGKNVSGPARGPLPPIPVSVEGGTIRLG